MGYAHWSLMFFSSEKTALISLLFVAGYGTL